MHSLELYIEDQRVDLFQAESIQIRSSIQDVRDISKVFTDYSQSFTLPASATNNKIFKHFYKHEIQNGFDARKIKAASVFLNYSLYRNGQIFLEGVNMKNNLPYSYRVTFYGNMVTLKDLIGDRKLTSLDLSDFNHDYDYSTIKTIFTGTGLTVDSDNSALIYPLITAKKRLFYDDTLTHGSYSNYDGNLYIPDTGNDIDRYHMRGVKEIDLKPAIKVYHIIKAIESEFGVRFIHDNTSGTEDFFSSANDAFSNLYLWASNSGGNIIDDTEDGYFYKKKSAIFTRETDPVLDSGDSHTNFSFVYDLLDDFGYIVVDSTYKNFQKKNVTGTRKIQFFLAVTPDSGDTTKDYRCRLKSRKTNEVVAEITGEGNQTVSFTLPTIDEDQTFYVELSSKVAMTAKVQFIVKEEGNIILPSANDKYEYNYSNISTTAERIEIGSQLPDMKIIDFLTGLFKMFNLTAYYIDDESDPEYDADVQCIKVVTLDDYYADCVNNISGGITDITNYIDIADHEVNTSLPFSEIDFRYKENKTILEEHHLDEYGYHFGNTNLTLNKLFGDVISFTNKYEIKLPFTILKYEKLAGTDGIQYGYAAGGDFDVQEAILDDNDNITQAPKGNYQSQNIPPLLFYGVRETTHTAFNFSDGGSTQVTRVTSGYYRPSNTNETAVANSDGEFDTPADFSLTFDAEPDEFLQVDFGELTNSLFRTYYENYILSVFEPEKRIYRFKAHFDAKFLVNFKMNDQLKIHDTVYRVNSIDVNLNTGLASLELINLTVDEVIT